MGRGVDSDGGSSSDSDRRTLIFDPNRLISCISSSSGSTCHTHIVVRIHKWASGVDRPAPGRAPPARQQA
eukprot:SAG11_NODE_17587_length_514_cov_0.867470_1_plen_69_part_10